MGKQDAPPDPGSPIRTMKFPILRPHIEPPPALHQQPVDTMRNAVRHLHSSSHPSTTQPTTQCLAHIHLLHPQVIVPGRTRQHEFNPLEHIPLELTSCYPILHPALPLPESTITKPKLYTTANSHIERRAPHSSAPRRVSVTKSVSYLLSRSS